MGVDVQKRVDEQLGQSTVNELIKEQLQKKINLMAQGSKGILIRSVTLHINDQNKLAVRVTGHEFWRS